MKFKARNNNLAGLRSLSQDSTLWHSIEDEQASNLVGGSSVFSDTLITEVTLPKLDESAKRIDKATPLIAKALTVN